AGMRRRRADMAVYGDDAGILAEGRNGSRAPVCRRSHPTADTPQELDQFAARLGPRRERVPPSRAAGRGPALSAHDGGTSGKRAQALEMGAISMPSRELALHCRARAGQLTPSIDHEGARGEDALPRRPRTAPEKLCPDCGTAGLTYGRRVCRACGLLRIL